jgi:general stress protein 26
MGSLHFDRVRIKSGMHNAVIGMASSDLQERSEVIVNKDSKSIGNVFRLCFVLMSLFVAFSPECKTQERPTSDARRDSLIAAAREIIGAEKYCALITVDLSGNPRVRTMNPFPPDDDMVVWMATNSRSRKIQEIRADPRVCLYYANHGAATGYVSITGKAILVDDTSEKIKRKREYWTQAFPDWKYLLLIKVVPEKLEVINYKRGFVNDPKTWDPPSVEFRSE